MQACDWIIHVSASFPAILGIPRLKWEMCCGVKKKNRAGRCASYWLFSLATAPLHCPGSLSMRRSCLSSPTSAREKVPSKLCPPPPKKKLHYDGGGGHRYPDCTWAGAGGVYVKVTGEVRGGWQLTHKVLPTLSHAQHLWAVTVLTTATSPMVVSTISEQKKSITFHISLHELMWS